MRRRDFIKIVAGSAAASSLPARAQPSGRMRRIGVLMGIAQDAEGETRVTALREALREGGWTEGHNIIIEYRWAAGSSERIDAAAAELVALRPDVILSNSANCLVALRNMTQAIPIVFVLVSDPVGMGQVETLARPGGNVTGFTPFVPSLGGKWVELLKELSPGLAGVVLFFNRGTAPNVASFRIPGQAAATKLTLHFNSNGIGSYGEIEEFMQEAGRSLAGAVLLPDPFNTAQRARIASAAMRYGVPSISPFRYFADAGGLASYGINPADEHRRAATYIDRILRGEKPAELPVQAPTKFELVVNMKTAKALGLHVPESFLLRADDVIE
jgi:putative ABC transport system substrate-binding protein